MYRVLYRKWRPKTFSDVVGQEHITGTLLSQINENRVAHAYLFTGSRGTGKTTCAKIFAKAVNCPNAVNGEPCNCCEVCASIDNGSNLDVVEMDAASNRNLDDIKELLDEVNYPPSNSKFRVYIIDEVHMLTNFAFNALLKTLEEPPEYVRFVLATTEVQKMPATILSRCQRFDFRRIEPAVISARLRYIASQEGGEIDEDAGEYIAKIADGGMRDSLSLLDRCLSITNHVTSDIVAESAGLIGREHLYDIIRHFGSHDTSGCLNILDSLHRNSCDTERLCSDLTECFRNFLVLKTVENPADLIICTADELNTIKEVSNLFTTEGIIYSLSILTSAAESMRNSRNRRIEAEMAFIRLCRPESETSIDALTERISRLETEISELKKNGVKMTSQHTSPQEKPSETKTVIEKPSQARPAEIFTETQQQNKSVQPSTGFSGFSDVVANGGTFADAFASLGNEDDDEPVTEPVKTQESSGSFDFASFMKSAADSNDDEPAFDIPGGEASFSDEDVFFPTDDMAPPDNDTYIPSAPEENEQTEVLEKKVVVNSPVRNSDSYESGSNPVPPKSWMSIVRKFEAANNVFIGQLTGSNAEIRGNILIVHTCSNNFLPADMLIPIIAPAAEEVLGKKYTIQIIKG